MLISRAACGETTKNCGLHFLRRVKILKIKLEINQENQTIKTTANISCFFFPAVFFVIDISLKLLSVGYWLTVLLCLNILITKAGMRFYVLFSLDYSSITFSAREIIKKISLSCTFFQHNPINPRKKML